MGVPAKGQVIVLTTDDTVVREVGEKRDENGWFKRSIRCHLDPSGKTLCSSLAFCFLETGSQCLASSGCPGTYHVD